MNAPHLLAGLGVALVTLCSLSGCASSGQRASTGETPQTATAQAGVSAPRSGNPFVLTSAEIAASPGLLNAYAAVEALRPHFLRARGMGSQPNTSGAPGATPPRTRRSAAPEDPGIVVYLDRQRYGRLETLRELSVASIQEIRFLNVGEATSLFGIGHPHGAIQVITKRGSSSQ